LRIQIREAKDKELQGLVRKHVKADKKFAEALLREGVDAMLQRRLGYRSLSNNSFELAMIT
jgi:hypothetical protein